MQDANLALVPLISGLLGGLVALGVGVYLARRQVAAARASAARLAAEAQREADARNREILVASQEKALAVEEESDRRERELEEREGKLESKSRQVEQESNRLARERERLERRSSQLDALESRARASDEAARARLDSAQLTLERISGLTADEARRELLAGIEEDARREGARMARKIEDEARQNAERESRNLIVQASQRVNLRDVMESTVSFIELPNDEMKGRIIGKEGRNIRALEMATGIDLIVDDTPRSIWISSFDPLRREVARVAIDRLLEDGRIHPARIEEVVQQVTDGLDTLLDEKGSEAAFSLGISDLHPKLIRLVGRMRYHTSHGQNLLQHAQETALIAGFMCIELGGRPDVAHRAGLLHEIGQVAEATTHSLTAAADLAGKYRESEEVVHAIHSLHPDVQPTTLEALLLGIANRLSESRPGARKENLAVFIERLRRLEGIATSFPGVARAFAVKAGKELRVIIDAKETRDENAYALSKQIARRLEKELSYPGQIKVSVVRETRAVRFAV